MTKLHAMQLFMFFIWTLKNGICYTVRCSQYKCEPRGNWLCLKYCQVLTNKYCQVKILIKLCRCIAWLWCWGTAKAPTLATFSLWLTPRRYTSTGNGWGSPHVLIYKKMWEEVLVRGTERENHLLMLLFISMKRPLCHSSNNMFAYMYTVNTWIQIFKNIIWLK